MKNYDIKVVIVEDSSLMRLILSDIVNTADGMTVIGTASDGKEAVDTVVKLKPDVVLMDMNMGEYDGLYGVKNILERQNIPIIILSAVGNSNLEPILEALSLGAFDYINKPIENKAKVRLIDDQITEKIKAAATANNVHFTINKNNVKSNNNLHTFDSELQYKAIAIGASTGGPTAIEEVITKLPANLPIPVLIGQHMPANFVHSFVDRLDKLTPLTVKVGVKDEKVRAGFIYMAPGDNNMIVKKNLNGDVVIDFSSKKYKEFNHPSINALMLSVSAVFGAESIGVILTGMGRDGADGMEAIYNSGGYTIGQDEKSSVVYGMPKEVAMRKVIRNSVSISEMGGFIISCLS